MKITNLCKKLAATFVAGGLMLPVASNAADLSMNLVIDPGFEDINETTSEYNNRQLNSWADGTIRGYTYASGQYDLGGPLAGGGERYFTSNGGDNADGPGQVAQLIDVSTGDTGAVIASGLGLVTFSSFMTSFAGFDTAFLQVAFLDGGGSILGDSTISDADITTWTFNSGQALIPVGTESLLVSVWGIAGSGGPDGYQDNVDVRITAVPEPTSVVLVLAAGLLVGVASRSRQTL